MASASEHGAAGQDRPEDSFSVLVGWTHREAGDRLDLNLQAIQLSRRDEGAEPDSHHFLLTRSQAAVLANYLLRISRMAPPPRPARGFFGRLLRG